MYLLTIIGAFISIIFLYKVSLILNAKKYPNNHLDEDDIKYNNHSRFINTNLK